MTKIVCFGVRDTEIEYFMNLNKGFGFDLKLVKLGLNHENVTEALGAKIIMVRGNCKADRRNLEILKKEGLEIVLTRTVGFDHVDLSAIKELNLKAARVPGYSPNAIAELAVTNVMMLLRHTAYTVNKTRKKDFTVDATMFSKEVRNCTVGVIGVGKIGLTTAKLFKGLGANVVGYDVYQSEEAKEVVEFMDMNDVLNKSDIISIHTPYIKDVNYHFINKDFINNMKDGAILVNTARGEVQDIDAIIEALEHNKLSGFATDVLEGEGSIFMKDLSDTKLSNDSYEKLVNLYPKAIITPHIGSYTDEALTNMIEISYENAKELLETGKCKNSIG